jgi:hypothetical protein
MIFRKIIGQRKSSDIPAIASDAGGPAGSGIAREPYWH